MTLHSVVREKPKCEVLDGCRKLGNIIQKFEKNTNKWLGDVYMEARVFSNGLIEISIKPREKQQIHHLKKPIMKKLKEYFNETFSEHTRTNKNCLYFHSDSGGKTFTKEVPRLYLRNRHILDPKINKYTCFQECFRNNKRLEESDVTTAEFIC